MLNTTGNTITVEVFGVDGKQLSIRVERELPNMIRSWQAPPLPEMREHEAATGATVAA